ncbi:MAG: cytochrome b/b6 domain-containing protein [Pseudomonadota bacterium]
MTLTNTDTHFGSVTKGFHWLTALLILTLIPLGWIANQLPYTTDAELARKAWLFSLHKTLGVAAFFVASLRILWALSQQKPGLLNADKKLESFAAEIVHWTLYGALVIVPLSGWISHAAAAGFAPIWWPFGQDLPLVPKSIDVEHFFIALHLVSTKVLILSLVLHIGGAFKHHLIDRDGTLRRMLPGPVNIPRLDQPAHSRAPFSGALLVWAVAVGIGALLANSSPKESIAAIALEEVASDWAVTEGEIGLTVNQFGSDVAGSFADWTASITFDETVTEGEAGSVTTTIAIPSLTLGSVTSQAMGADFFDATTHPTAVFAAALMRADAGYVAEGTLTIKETEVPITLPFSLNIEGDTATVQAEVSLDRRDFGIGASVGDESSLRFGVDVAITLTATRGAE